MICNLGVVGSNPTRGSRRKEEDRRTPIRLVRKNKKGTLSLANQGGNDMGVFQSGQMGQTVNLLSFDFGGSNPSAPTQEMFAEIAQLIEH